ncbi:hypothetical protein BU17DRAFT_66134 [Hysterangium stoloniferum]|nr:hypothetical protein BU17DRAFT_66134 [Hysterangium stoloniferum]
MHTSLACIQPFWSSAVSNRLGRLHIFCPNSGQIPEDAHDVLEGRDTDFTPLITQYVYSNSQGSFQTTITVPCENMATLPPSLHIRFGKFGIEYPVVIQAEMWPAPSTTVSAESTPQSPASSKLPTPPVSTAVPVKGSSHIVTRAIVPLPVPLRLISDIDDIIKYAEVSHGAKNVFQNVFTRHLEGRHIHPSFSACGGWHRIRCFQFQYTFLPVREELINLELQAMNPMPSRDLLYWSTISLSKSYSPSIGSNSSPVQMGAFVTHASTPSMLPGIPPRGKTQAGMTPEEHRRQELEIPIEYARAEILSHIAFRVFRTPEECIDMQDIVREHPKKVA